MFVFTWWKGRVHNRQRETVQICSKVNPLHVLVTLSYSMRLEFRHRKLWWLIRLFYLKQALQRNWTYKTHTYIYEIYCKNWHMQLWRPGTNTACSLQIGEPGKPVVQFSPSLYSSELVALMLRAGKARHSRSRRERVNLPLLHLFVPSWSSTYWMKPTHMDEDGFFSQSTRSNINLFQKHFHRNQK